MSCTESNHAVAFAIVAIVLASAVGVGFALDYTGTTTSSSQDVQIHYMVIEIDGNGSGRLNDAFHFTSAASKPNFYADIVVGNGSSTTNYRTVETVNISTEVHFEITAANTAECTLSAQLTEIKDGMTVYLMFYENEACSGTPAFEQQISTGETDIGTFTCNHDYWCKAKVVLESHNYGSEKPTALPVNITFKATAELQED